MIKYTLYEVELAIQEYADKIRAKIHNIEEITVHTEKWDEANAIYSMASIYIPNEKYIDRKLHEIGFK